MEFICAKCQTKLEKTAKLLIKGCPHCGSKVFSASSPAKKAERQKIEPEVKKESIEKQFSATYQIIPKLLKEEQEKQRSALAKDTIPSVKLKQKGIYEVNVDSLFRDKKTDPIILSGKSGIYRVEIVPVNKNKRE
jgi:predicted  nucleic acid-binding Zn-ribbon protein